MEESLLDSGSITVVLLKPITMQKTLSLWREETKMWGMCVCVWSSELSLATPSLPIKFLPILQASKTNHPWIPHDYNHSALHVCSALQTAHTYSLSFKSCNNPVKWMILALFLFHRWKKLGLSSCAVPYGKLLVISSYWKLEIWLVCMEMCSKYKIQNRFQRQYKKL